MEKITLQINNEALRSIYGDEVVVAAKNGRPKDRYWRNRLADAAKDGCVSIAPKKKAAATKKGGGE